ncbi:uncharacterized protein JCM15063_003847 [Sporobolomyces koalae]|uniref:uncharacterized protein n=1 Tax=Sporobolomyces koalae TaxID=500713 RepID=UPI00317DBC33
MTSVTEQDALIEQANALLDQYASHSFASTQFSSTIPIKSLASLAGSGNQQYTDNLTRTTAAGGYDQTGVSEDGLVMVQEDRNRTKDDLKEFKDRISTLKFAYLEQNARTEFLKHLVAELDENGNILPISKEDNQKIAGQRNEIKMSLRRKKEKCRELETLIRREAEQLEEPLRKQREQAEYASRLVRECEAMETEIAMLKNKRSPSERMTLREALSTVDQQVSQITQFGQRSIEAEQELKQLRPLIKQAKLANERLGNSSSQLEREKREREAKGGGIDERAEQGCEWIEHATRLYKSLLGIDETYVTNGATGSTRSIAIAFTTMKGTAGGQRSMSIELGPDGRMTGAKLVDSSESIQDLVKFYLPTQDVRGLVQEVRTRILST